MGSPFAPSLANLFITNFEEKLFFDSERNPFHKHILIMRHFIDDIFILFAERSRFNGSIHFIL